MFLLLLTSLFLLSLSFINIFRNKNCKSKSVQKYSQDMMYSSATIVGTARDIEKYLPTTIKKIELISNTFKKVNIIIYENDSIDNTLKILNNWKLNSKYDIKIISETNIPGKRTHRLSYARNLLLDEALKLNNYYLIVIDLDDVNSSLTIDNFLSSFSYENDWACLCANQKDKYYDLWALRTKDDWMNFDCWQCFNEKNDIDFCVKSREKNLPVQKKLIEVESCFGGLAIYKTKYLRNCKYYGGKDDFETCEHVNFNNDIRNKNNGTIFINTNMINS